MTREYIYYGFDDLSGKDELCTARSLEKSIEEFNGHKLVRFDVGPGMHTPDDQLIVLTPESDFNLFDYPYMAVSYRTRANILQCDMSIKYVDAEGSHESWTERARPGMVCDTNIRSFVYDVRKTDAVCFPKNGYESYHYLIKPFGGYAGMLTKPYFFSLEYVAFFKTFEEAEAYNVAHAVEPVEIAPARKVKTYRVSDYGKRYYGDLPVNVFTGLDIKYNLCLSPRSHELDTKLREDGSMCFTANPGFYMMDQNVIVISSAGANISFLKYPHVKLAVKTSTGELQAQVRYDKSKCGFVKLEGVPCGCGYTVYSLDINELCENKINNQVRNVTLALRACEHDNKRIETPYTLELLYAGFFESAEDAALYSHSSVSYDDYLASHPMAYKPQETSIDFTELNDYSVAEKYITESEALKKTIINSENHYFESEYGNTYYVSSINGDDENDGLSPERAWRTCKHLNEPDLIKEYDYVLFERGSLFRVDERVMLKDGVTYSAYGEGEKPKLYGSVDASGKDSWLATDAPNIWVYKDTVPASLDIGNIVCDGGKAWGIKALVNGENIRQWQGYCYNGFEGFYVDKEEFPSYASLKHNMEYWHDWKSGRVYLYLELGNPGEYFNEIELSRKMSVIGGRTKSCVIDNLCIMYTGVHGIGMGSIEDVTVQYCELGWIGGSIQSPAPGSTGRLGNAVECFGYAKNYVIHDCYAYQVYDCCFTTQWQGTLNDDIVMNGIRFYNNVAELSNTGLETWLASHVLYSENKYGFRNMELFNNYNLYMGYGWSHQRTNKGGNFFYGDVLMSDTYYENCRVHDNVNVYSSHVATWARYSGKSGFDFYDNVYVLERDRDFAWTAATPSDGTGRFTSFRFDKSRLNLLAAHTVERGSKFYSVPSDSKINIVAEKLFENEGLHDYGYGSRIREN
ncbi:MAG: hypothetical protein IJ391_02280 [Clostridia bacterium]|nr:hypothetical protein [Clostridia bacterium]